MAAARTSLLLCALTALLPGSAAASATFGSAAAGTGANPLCVASRFRRRDRPQPSPPFGRSRQALAAAAVRPRWCLAGFAAGQPRQQPPAALSPRLQSCFDLVPRHAVCVADVCCDHALLAEALARDGRTVVASDAAAEPLRSARARAPRGVDFRLGPGLATLTADDNCTCAVVAGVGTSTVLSILDSAPREVLSVLDTLVLQPQGCDARQLGRLRTWLAASRFAIVDERIVAGPPSRKGPRYHFAIRADRRQGATTTTPSSDDDAELGSVLPAARVGSETGRLFREWRAAQEAYRSRERRAGGQEVGVLD